MTEIDYRRPWLYPKQRAALFHGERYGLVEASTKSGKTVGCLAWLLEQALQGKAHRNYWWVAPVYSQTKIAYRRMRDGLPRRLYRENKSERILEIANKTRVWFKTGERPDNLYGEDVYAAVVDEASRLREEAWHAVRSTLTATRGPVRIIGNVKGRRNWFYKLARKAEAGEPGMRYAKLTWRDAVEAGVLDEAEVEDARRQLPEQVFQELYAAEASDDEGNPFGMEAIDSCIAPMSDEEPAVWGWDLAKSVDWTVGVALDYGGTVCRFERWQGVPWSETERRIALHTQSTPALVDATGVGDPIVERLQEVCGSSIEGFKFTPSAKQQLMEGLAVAIQSGDIRYPDGLIPAELRSFEYTFTRTGVRYEAMEGLNDDCVDALALAVRRQTRRGGTIFDIARTWGSVEDVLAGR